MYSCALLVDDMIGYVEHKHIPWVVQTARCLQGEIDMTGVVQSQ